MIDAEDVAVGQGQEVADLAIRVVYDGIENGHPAQAGVVADDHLDQVHAIVGTDPLLDHPRPERPLTEHRGRDDAPAAGLGDQERGDLATGQGPDGEVEERALGNGRLVDGVKRLAQVRVMDEDDEGLVRRAGQAPEDLERAIAERRQGRGIRPSQIGGRGRGWGRARRSWRGGRCGRSRVVS